MTPAALRAEEAALVELGERAVVRGVAAVVREAER
jgi:hypothetical protein